MPCFGKSIALGRVCYIVIHVCTIMIIYLYHYFDYEIHAYFIFDAKGLNPKPPLEQLLNMIGLPISH